MNLAAPVSGATATTAGEYIASAPPLGMHPVTNLYWDPATQKMVVEYDDTGAPTGVLISTPPQGSYPITNVYFNPASGTFVGEYEDA